MPIAGPALGQSVLTAERRFDRVSTVLNAYCDVALAHCAPTAHPSARPRLVLATTILGSGMAFVDGSVVSVALPAIGRTFTASANSLQWSVNAYLLPLSALLLLGGAAGDRFGRERVFLMGIVLFALASAGCALAPGFSVLLLARFCQGIGAAALMPNSLAILGETFSGPARGRAVGIWAAASSIAGAIGPVLGGWLIDLGSWRAIFLINLPLALVAAALALLCLPRAGKLRAEPLDLRGGLLVTAGLGALTWALTRASGATGWSVDAGVAGAAAVVLLSLFLRVQIQRRDRALIPFTLLGSGALMGINALTLLLYGSLGGLLVLVPYVLIEAAGYSSAAAGAALLPLPIIQTISAPLAGTLAERIGPRRPITVGSLALALGLLLMLNVRSDTSYWTGLLPALVSIGVGLSAAVAPLTTAVLSSVDARYNGAASGLNSAVARAGGLVATALLGTALALHGTRLIASFHFAMVLAAVCCVLAALVALWLVPTRSDAHNESNHA
jgi:EmrB/QacA subfamily drug resistance transporter